MRYFLSSIVLCIAINFCAPANLFGQTGKESFLESPFPKNNTVKNNTTKKHQPQSFTRKNQTASRRITPPSNSDKNGTSLSNSDRKIKANGLSIWTTFGSLALIVGLILLIAKLFKKNGGLSSGGLPREAIEVLGRQPIDARQSIHLIRLGSRILVIGSSPEGMRTLTEIADPVEVDYLAGVCQTNQEKSPFTNAFRTFFTQTGSHDLPIDRQNQSAVEVPADQGLADQFQSFSSQNQPLQNRPPQSRTLRRSSTERNQPHG